MLVCLMQITMPLALTAPAASMLMGLTISAASVLTQQHLQRPFSCLTRTFC